MTPPPPPPAPLKPISGSELTTGSAPDLSCCGDYGEEDFTNINIRKRKERTDEQDLKNDFATFRNEMMMFFQDFGKTQTQNLLGIREEISEIRNEIQSIKNVTEKFTQQFEHINTEITDIKTENKKIQHKINDMEFDMSRLKTHLNAENSSLSPPNVLASENLIHELRDRVQREKNIIIIGINEKEERDFKLRRAYDDGEVLKVITSINNTCPKPARSIRLGKYNPNKNRPIKVYFNEPTTPRELLRNKLQLPDNIKMYADQTPAQKQYWLSLREDLKKRTDNGEKDLIIKYINGTPKITKNNDVNKQKN